MNSAARKEFERVRKEEKRPELFRMTPARYDVLHVVAEHLWWDRTPGPRKCPTSALPMKDLIMWLGLHPSTVSKTVSRMATLHLVRTYRDPDDKRKVLIVMREEGWIALKAARRIFRRRPQNFVREGIGTWFGRVGAPDTLESLRRTQCEMKALASTFGLESSPIHDVRCDLGRADHYWPRMLVYVRGRFRMTPPLSRRQTFG